MSSLTEPFRISGPDVACHVVHVDVGGSTGNCRARVRAEPDALHANAAHHHTATLVCRESLARNAAPVKPPAKITKPDGNAAAAK